MFTLPLPKLDLHALRRLDPTVVDLTRIDLTRLDVRNLELPQVDLPVERLTGLARDAVYVGVGASVVAAKAADDRRRALTDGVTARIRRLVDTVA